MITLQVIEPHWIKGHPDAPEDQCAHGHIQFFVDSVIYAAKEDGDWTISAAGLFLLRTVELDHTPQNSVAEGNYLIPCCGFSVWPTEGRRFPFSITGCNKGINPEIRHEREKVRLTLGEKESIVDFKEWAAAVLNFVRQVELFYENCSPKVSMEDELDRKGWKMFWQEWRQRKIQAEQQLKKN